MMVLGVKLVCILADGTAVIISGEGAAVFNLYVFLKKFRHIMEC